MSYDEKLKEYGAVTLLQRTLEKYAKQKNISFEKALKIFLNTPLYEGLFDYDATGLWKEGPDYLLSILEEICSKRTDLFTEGSR